MAVTGIYLSTLCRTVYVGDSGEFATVFKTLGIAHPPGYPLFTLAGHVFGMLVGFLTPALAANLFAALLAAMVIPVLFFLLEGPKRPFLTGFLTLLWALSPSFWGETTAVEVYGLNLLLIAVLALLALHATERRWHILFYLLGLALAHHLSAVMIIPALVYAIITDKMVNHRKALPYYLGFFIAGLSIYLYLPIRSNLSPIMDWGHPATLGLLFNHITAAQYQQAAAFSPGNLWSSVTTLIELLVGNWSWLGILAVVGGSVIGILRYQRRTIFSLLLLTTNVVLAAFYRIPDIDPYYLPGLFACWILISNVFIWLWENLAAPSYQRAIWATTGSCVLALLLFNYGQVNRSGERLAYDYGKMILDQAESGTLFTPDDNSSFAAIYLRYGEGYQPDVEVYDRATRMMALYDRAQELSGQMPRDYFTAREVLLQKAPGRKHLVKAHYPYSQEWNTSPGQYFSQGLLYSSTAPINSANLPSLSLESQAADFKTKQILINLELCRAEEFLLQSPSDTVNAHIAFKSALELLRDEPRGALHNQLGISFRHFGATEFALTAYERALQAERLTESERQEIIFNVSNVYKDQGNYLASTGDLTGAVTAYLKALDYDPNNPKLLYNIGVIYTEYLQRPEQGKPYLEAYLKLNPGDEKVKELVRSQ